MKIELIRPPLNYKPDVQPESAYERARQVWDDRLGKTTAQAANWRYAFFSSVILLLLLSAANLYQAVARKVVPFIITVNSNTGEPKAIGRVGADDYEVQAPEIRYFLTQLVRYIRALPADPVVIKQNWLSAYQFLTPQAANALNIRANSEDGSPLKMLGEKTVTVQPSSVNQIGQSNSYQVRWSEEVFDKQGGRVESYNMTGIFVLELKPPRNEKVLSVNPLGIYVKDFQWSREL